MRERDRTWLDLCCYYASSSSSWAQVYLFIYLLLSYIEEFPIVQQLFTFESRERETLAVRERCPFLYILFICMMMMMNCFSILLLSNCILLAACIAFRDRTIFIHFFLYFNLLRIMRNLFIRRNIWIINIVFIKVKKFN